MFLIDLMEVHPHPPGMYKYPRTRMFLRSQSVYYAGTVSMLDK